MIKNSKKNCTWELNIDRWTDNNNGHTINLSYYLTLDLGGVKVRLFLALCT
jgi:hypothetical protein